MTSFPRTLAPLVVLGAILAPVPPAHASVTPPRGAAAAQPRAPLVVQGRVTDEARNPLAGAQVGVEGAPAGAVTNDDGTYRLTLAQPAARTTLLVRRIGYRPQRLVLTQAEGTVTQDVSLVRDVLQLSEIVTTSTRVATERSQLGTTIATVGGDEIAKANTPQLDAALSGKVSGAFVQQMSGRPAVERACASADCRH